ncbi:unnamed protein product [Eretmochelys imbricata]
MASALTVLFLTGHSGLWGDPLGVTETFTVSEAVGENPPRSAPAPTPPSPALTAAHPAIPRPGESPSPRSISSHRGNRPSWAPAAGSPTNRAGGRRNSRMETGSAMTPGALVYAGSIPAEGTALIQPGAAPAPTRPSSAGPELLISPSELPNDSPLPPAAAPLGCPDFTHADIARLALSAMVLLIVGLILAEAHYSRPRVEPGSSRAEKKISPRDELLPLGGLKRRHKTSCSQTPLPR